MSSDRIVQQLQEQLFGERECGVYAVLDGASVPRLRWALWEHAPEHVCLYRGELEPDMATVAPYLVALRPDEAFTQWALQMGWGNHWGIFAGAPVGITFRDIRRHFRQFLLVKDAEGKPLYFRYYDPRVLQAFAPTCNGNELRVLFGPVAWYVAETRGGAAAVRLSLAEGSLRTETIELQRAVVEV
jgi:hypothetical protein